MERICWNDAHLGDELLGATAQDDGAALGQLAAEHKVVALVADLALLEATAGTEHVDAQVGQRALPRSRSAPRSEQSKRSEPRPRSENQNQVITIRTLGTTIGTLGAVAVFTEQF